MGLGGMGGQVEVGLGKRKLRAVEETLGIAIQGGGEVWWERCWWLLWY